MIDFFTKLYRNCDEGMVEIRALPSPQNPSAPVRKFFAIDKLSEVAEWCETCGKQRYHVYFGVGLRDKMSGDESSVCAIPALWCDIDFKDMPQHHADIRIDESPIPPSMIVNSGNGYHLYWIMKEPIESDEYGIFRQALVNIASFFNGDQKSTDIPRIMRVPGTKNRKTIPSGLCHVVTSNDVEHVLDSFEIFPTVERVDTSAKSILIEHEIPEGQRNAALSRWVGKWITEGKTTEECVVLARGWNQTYCQPPLPDHEILTIVRSISKAHTRNHPEESVRVNTKEPTPSLAVVTSTKELGKLVSEWVKEATGSFAIGDIYQTFACSSRAERTLVSQVLKKLVDAGEIERGPGKRGQFVIPDRDLVSIDFTSIDRSRHPLVLPFGLHERVRVMPKNIIVLAGEQNVGKTALLLHTVMLNIKAGLGGRIHYFSSEMGACEMRERLDLFDCPVSDWKFKAYERSTDFHTVIRPNDINIIDFMEVHDEFYKVGHYMRQIYDSLDQGVAIIAIQKNRGTDMGRGGTMSLEKPRLYLSLESQAPYFSLLRIVKAKNFVGENPNGLCMPYKVIRGGAKLTTIGDLRIIEDKDIKHLREESARMFESMSQEVECEDDECVCEASS